MLLLISAFLEGVVHDALLLADGFAELADGVLHFLVLTLLFGVLLALPHALHEIAHLCQHVLGLLAHAALGHLLHLAHHAVNVFRRELLIVLILPVGALLLVAAVLLLHLFGEFLERLAQLLHELTDFFVGGAFLQSLCETILNVTKVLFGFREIAVLYAQGRLP